MPKRLRIIPLFALYCVFASSVRAAQPALVSADWSVKSPHSLATNPPSDDAVIALVEKLADQDRLSLCSSHFADLRHSGNLSLVVSVSDGRFCSLSIIDKTGPDFTAYAAEQAHYSLGPEIEDLAGNGNLEMIVDTEFTSWNGGGVMEPCVATWPVIYAWTGSGYTDVSSQYKGYYEQQLASLKKQIAATPSATEQARAPAPNQTPESAPTMVPVHPPGSLSGFANGIPMREVRAVPAPEASSSPAATGAARPHRRPRSANDCTEAEAAKIQRFLGISRNAGMSDAIRWAKSDDPDKREFAADVFRDIGTTAAIEYLRTLSNDWNSMVSDIAKSDLEAGGRGPALHTINEQ
jgi:hypothetical protein